ncbi:MAG: hypothetical protein WCD69_09180, partial [Xanthobacteraceae bacterium]
AANRTSTDLQNDFILPALSLVLVSGKSRWGFRYQPLNLKLTPARTRFSVKLALIGTGLPALAAVQTAATQFTEPLPISTKRYSTLAVQLSAKAHSMPAPAVQPA